MMGSGVLDTLHVVNAQMRRAASVIRLHPFDTSSPEGRSKERYRRVALATLATIGARAISLFTTIISVPLTLNYLGAERYGLWITISSTIAMLGFADLGLGNGLVNAIADAHGKDDRATAQRHVSSAFFMLAGIAAILSLAFLALYPAVPWDRLFNVKSDLAVAEAGPAVAVFTLCFTLNLPLGVVQRVQMGYQELYANALWQTLGSVLGLGGVVLAVHWQAGLPWLVLAMAGAPAFAGLLNTIGLFGFQRPWLRPHLSRVGGESVRTVSRIGFLFFVLQIVGALGFQSDNIVIAQVLGADQVAQYAVPAKLFSLAPMMLSFALTPLWPAYGEAISRGDLWWVRKTFVRSVILGFAVNLVPALLLVAFGNRVLGIWVGHQVHASNLLLVGLGAWAVANSLNGPIAMLLNGAGVIAFQVACNVPMGVFNLAASIFLAQRLGVSGVVYGSLLATVLCIHLPVLFYLPRLFSRWSGRKAPSISSRP